MLLSLVNGSSRRKRISNTGNDITIIGCVFILYKAETLHNKYLDYFTWMTGKVCFYVRFGNYTDVSMRITPKSKTGFEIKLNCACEIA